ncbi:MAG: hypothetical protein QM756_40435 [Polyangiaceae bacterium]
MEQSVNASTLAALAVVFGLCACSGADGAAEPLAAPTRESGTTIAGLSGSEEPSCAALAETAVQRYRPIDVVFVIDNSASMDDEIAAVERSINQDFAHIMDQSGLDYRVILVSRYGKLGTPVGESDNPICVGPPLGGADCVDPSRGLLQNGQRFFHYSANVGSHDAWCVLLGGYDQPDEYADTPRANWVSLAPQGWSKFLRPEAFKTFVAVSDDEVDCRVANSSFSDQASVSGGEVAARAFDATLLKLSPEQFGSARQRNYVWHSIVGMRGASLQQPVLPASAPMQTATCGVGAEGPGTGYQALSRLTGGLRYPSCDSEHFDAVFNTIATGIVSGAEIACQWQIPAPPAGQSFDRERVNVRHTLGDSGRSVSLGHVSDAAHCGSGGGWYYDDPEAPENIVVCPSSCRSLQGDMAGRVDVLFGCATQNLVR